MWVETQPSAQSSFQKLNVDNRFSKNMQNYILHFWGLVQFYCISLLFAKYFVQDCRFHQKIAAAYDEELYAMYVLVMWELDITFQLFWKVLSLMIA